MALRNETTFPIKDRRINAFSLWRRPVHQNWPDAQEKSGALLLIYTLATMALTLSLVIF